ncbi:methionine--tRNA ligase mes1 [Brettanomyces nanus]|uniref:methionine--tRNA ligase n=1 Tax=Eeniella nana TaxID=13502 RepID=A0A875RWU2_EENNA|nr:methionine--tRNA ligase mes1 [Brettanomyces nanus]QPG73008.1 methionine--tRNA ligase mes1 [Brettanomyces nanus]
MSSLQIFSDRGSKIPSLVRNLKIGIGAAVFQPSVKLVADTDNEEYNLTLVDKKSGFQLIEANAIVKYLAATSKKGSKDAFKVDPVELVLDDILKKRKFNDSILPLVKPFSQADATSIPQIFAFATLYPVLTKTAHKNEGFEDLKSWFNAFAALPEVIEGVKAVTSLTHLERSKEKNTGKRNVIVRHEVVKPEGKLAPKEGERNILITSALPYVNNVPHLGNIVGSVLSADIFARYCKRRNYNALFICGTDEYGTATETKALEEHVTPRELCTKYHKIHKDVYDWFDIGFDYFGRTTTAKQTEISQKIFLELHKNGYLEEQSMKQLYCPVHKGYLADRYVEGECPKCHYEDARGDQCDKCGTLLDPFELINPRCKLDNATPEPRHSNHIFISLDKLEPELKEWVKKSSTEGHWSKNAKTITNSWLREGLKPRCITRDLVWGTPVPLKGFEDKVLYVWFDATIGYVSITANYTDDWRAWWQNPEHVKLYQFMGKDNVPFHTVVFPSTEIATREPWTMLHHLNTTEYLQYEGGKFSKSRNIGVFGNNAKETGISPSVWRYYLTSIRPETQDSQFSWEEFVTKNNSELLANLGNFVNRIVKYVNAKYNGVVPQFDVKNCEDYAKALQDFNKLIETYNEDLDSVHERKGLETAMLTSARGNQFLQDNKLDNSLYNDHPDKADAVVAIGLNIVYLVSALISPYMPEATSLIEKILNVPELRIPDKLELWIQGGHCIGKPQYLFSRIDEKKVEEWRAKYGGQHA